MTRVGINGMGRIGRLALRAAMGGMYRAADDPRADNRLDVVHVNEIKGGAATAAHLLEFDSIHGRWRENFRVEDDRAIHVGNRRIGFSDGVHFRWRRRGAIWAATSCWNAPASFSSPSSSTATFRRGVKRVIVAAPVKEAGALNIVVGVNDQLYEPARAPPADRGILHDQLPRARGQGGARGDRHPPRPDHHHPRSDQHQRGGRRAAQGSAARALGDAVAVSRRRPAAPPPSR